MARNWRRTEDWRSIRSARAPALVVSRMDDKAYRFFVDKDGGHRRNGNSAGELLLRTQVPLGRVNVLEDFSIVTMHTFDFLPVWKLKNNKKIRRRNLGNIFM